MSGHYIVQPERNDDMQEWSLPTFCEYFSPWKTVEDNFSYNYGLGLLGGHCNALEEIS
jgi:hypothetical protein